MLKKLLPLYEHAIFSTSNPIPLSNDYYVFFDENQNEWLGIPKDEVKESELALLRKLFQFVEEVPNSLLADAAKWCEFLLKDGSRPVSNSVDSFRFIQFFIKDAKIDPIDIESALKGFFTEDVVIVWEDALHGIIIEEKKNVVLSEKEMVNLSETLESDFYVKVSFYIGKVHPNSDMLPEIFQQEKRYFSFGLNYLRHIHIFTFERIFPSFIASHLPAELKVLILEEVRETLTEDSEIFTTIKAFLENNLNASVTAKKLFIHRNTLQYRIDKFTEKTGIGLKDFYGAFTVFLACLVVEQETRR